MNLLHTIFNPAGDGPHPTILALHGWGANAMDLLGLAPYICSGRFLVICPQGPVQTPIGAGAVGYGWFPLMMGAPPDIPAIQSAKEQLAAFIELAMERYPIDPKRLVILGFSQGGVMAYSLMLSTPERFAALAAISSWMPQELVQAFSPVGSPRFPYTLVQHGSRDELIEIDRARGSIERLRDLRVPVTYREYDIGHEISSRSLADLSSWLQDKVFSSIVTPG